MKILIVDDEAPARERLRQIIEEGAEHEVVGEAANGVEALRLVADGNPDVVLLDIRMPGMNGIETAHHINELEAPPAIVFTTAYDEYAIDAFDAQAIGYVLKPVRRERLRKALEQAARLGAGTLGELARDANMESRRSHICVQHHGELKLIRVESILFFQADQKYTRLADGEREYLIDDSLKQLEEEYADLFVRIHRNALVAVSQIDTLQKTTDGEVLVRLRDNITPENEPLKVSRRHVAAVRRRLKGTAN
jgi:two-component system response regulator AlgR